MSRYVDNQAALVGTPGGAVAAKLVPGDRRHTREGEEVIVWRAWSPDLAGVAEVAALKYKFPFDPGTHNTTVGVTIAGKVSFINVAKCDTLIG